MYGYNFIRNNEHNYAISLHENVGEHDKQVVLAVHGLNGNKEANHINAFRYMANQNSIGVVAMDLPGHGGSLVNYITLENCINDIRYVEEYIKDKYKVDKVSVLGNSFGAYLLLLSIIKQGNRFDSVVLDCPAIKMDELMYNNILKYFSGNLENWSFNMQNDDKILHVTYNIYKELCENRILDQFRKEDAHNVHIIHGNCDELAPLSVSEEFTRKNNNSLDIINGANHTFDVGLEEATQKTYKYIKRY